MLFYVFLLCFQRSWITGWAFFFFIALFIFTLTRGTYSTAKACKNVLSRCVCARGCVWAPMWATVSTDSSPFRAAGCSAVWHPRDICTWCVYMCEDLRPPPRAASSPVSSSCLQGGAFHFCRNLKDLWRDSRENAPVCFTPSFSLSQILY